MKKLLVSLLVVFVATQIHAQSPLGEGGKQLNAGLGFSNFGTPVYVGVDIGIHEDITVGPQISYRNHNPTLSGSKFNLGLTVLGFNGNYHFDSLLELPSEWNVYAGATLGYYIWSSPSDYDGNLNTGLGLDGQIGARYFFSDTFGMNLELGGGTASGGKIGITYKF